MIGVKDIYLAMHLDYPTDESLFSFKYVDIMISSKKPKLALIAKNKAENKFSMIGIKMIPSKPLSEMIYLIQKNLNEEQLEHEISRMFSKPQDCKIIQTHGLIGFTQFLQGYYLLYIQSVYKIAKVGRHKIKMIKKTGILPLFELLDDNNKAAQKKYQELLRSYKLQNYYFSYSYDLTNSLFWNTSKYSKDIPICNQQPKFSQSSSLYGICQIFQWNYNLVKQFDDTIKMRQWVLPIIHGYCKHMNIKTRGTTFAVVIISRRSRHHAGTRYIKRGINQEGFVANFVQTQQVVVNTSSGHAQPNFSSFIQVRGSAPVYWMQQPNFVNPKPAIELVGSDPMFLSTKKHFGDLISHYGRHIFCINLMKTIENTPRQTILSAEYRHAVSLINQQFQQIQDTNRIHYMQTDFKANQKINKYVFVERIKSLAYYCILKIGFYQCQTQPRSPTQLIELQNGVIRANCVDCLDRTNSFQQLVGETALSIQIARMLNQQINIQTLSKDLGIFQDYGATFEQMGDLISIQYGSSLAHKQQVNKTETTRFQFMTSMTRHINNTFNDNERQQQIDVFLRVFDPTDGHVWDTKPSITMFPNQFIRQKITKYWERKSHNSFLKQNSIDMFKREYQSPKKGGISNIHYLTKHDLIVTFSTNVADEMYTDLQEDYQFCIQTVPKAQPSLKKKSSIKSPIKKNLEQKLKQEYYRKNSKLFQNYESHYVPYEPELTGSMTEQSNFFNSIVNQVVPEISLHKIQSSAQILVVNQTHPQFDLQQIQPSIRRYLEGQMADQNMILNDIQLATQNIYDPDVQLPTENPVSEQQINYITQKIISMDYITQNGINEGNQKSPDRRQRRRTLISPIKSIKVQEVKAQVLEEIIKRNFSHGCKVGKIRII